MDPVVPEPESEELGQNQLPVEDDTEPGDDATDAVPSPASQIGRAAQSGGTPESGAEPGDEARAGWPMPDQKDTPSEWPRPTTDG